VLDSKAKRWNGRVNFVYRNNPGSYYPNFFASELARRLLAEGYACSSLAVVKNAAGVYDFSILEQAADRSPDLTVLLFNDAQIERRLSRLGNPFAVVGKTPCTLKGCVGNVRLNRDAVVPEFVMQCRINGVRSVLQVGQIASDTAAVAALRAAGVRAAEWVIEPEVGGLRPGSVERAAYTAFSRRLKGGCGWLPEVLFFTDDYTARGALSALLERGVGIPGDVGVVTWSNLGNEIALGRELSTMQMNPIEHGGTVACCMMSYLRGRGFPADIQIGPTFRPGASFPVPGRKSNPRGG
jgi:DNA-binding LacI/PurR family transcriptional regulator